MGLGSDAGECWVTSSWSLFVTEDKAVDHLVQSAAGRGWTCSEACFLAGAWRNLMFAGCASRHCGHPELPTFRGLKSQHGEDDGQLQGTGQGANWLGSPGSRHSGDSEWPAFRDLGDDHVH